MKRKVRGVVLVVMGLMLTFGGAALYTHYESQANLAGQNAQVLLQELSLDMQQRQLMGITVEAPENQMLQVTIEGQAVIGILRAEEAAIELPVLQSWDYEKLMIAPCRYSGSIEEGNLILLGHNYKQHLEKLDQLEPGDAVEFVDVEGKSYSFVVAETVVLQPTQVEELTSTDHPLTIFTCTPNGRSRFVVYCDLE